MRARKARDHDRILAGAAYGFAHRFHCAARLAQRLRAPAHEVIAEKPFDILYADPKDDPRKQARK